MTDVSDFFDVATAPSCSALPPTEIQCKKENVVFNRQDCHRADANIREGRFCKSSVEGID